MVPALLLTAWACGQDKSVTFARLLERAASWGASVEFAQELAQQGTLPRRYVQDLMATASVQLTTIAGQIDSSEGIDADAKRTASASCSRLATITGDAARTDASAPQAPIRELELQLRATAQQARGGASAR